MKFLMAAIAALFFASLANPANAMSKKQLQVKVNIEQSMEFSARRRHYRRHHRVRHAAPDYRAMRAPAMGETMTPQERSEYYTRGGPESYTPKISKRHTRHTRHTRRTAKAIAANGNLGHRLVTVSTAAGIKITVHPAFADKFQSFISDLVRQGHKPRFITCYARGHVPGSNHHWGGACDIDQTGWNRTSGFMYHAGAAIRANGLHDGCSFRDCGHVEAMRGTHNRPPNLYAAVEKFKQQQSEAGP